MWILDSCFSIRGIFVGADYLGLLSLWLRVLSLWQLRGTLREALICPWRRPYFAFKSRIVGCTTRLLCCVILVIGDCYCCRPSFLFSTDFFIWLIVISYGWPFILWCAAFFFVVLLFSLLNWFLYSPKDSTSVYNSFLNLLYRYGWPLFFGVCGLFLSAAFSSSHTAF